MLDSFNCGPYLGKQHLAHERHKMYAILHFGLNTFTDKEWGYGDEDPALFNPTDFDAEQIAQACKDGGLTGLILVCKHHDGFCLWPTKTTTHNISASPFRGGKGDLVREIADACRRHNLAFGTYLSPWDRNNTHYGTPEYLAIYREQLRELLTNYGELFEVWFDGANGGDGYYGGARETRRIDQATYYDWENTWKIVRDLQPNAAIFSDVGPDLRWVGNEKGLAAPDATALFTPQPLAPDLTPAPGYLDTTSSPCGNLEGKYYMPPECDVPLRPGWFYHANEDDQVKSLPELLKIYLRSVGCGGTLNLGLAPDRRGSLHENDVRRLKEFHEALEKIQVRKCFSDSNTPTGKPIIYHKLNINCRFNALLLQESSTETGSTPQDPPRLHTEIIRDYRIDACTWNGWTPLAAGQTIGSSRIKVFSPITTDEIRITYQKFRLRPGAVSSLTVSLLLLPEEWVASADPAPAPPQNAIPLTLDPACKTTQTWTLPQPANIQGFIFYPATDSPANTPDQYRFDAKIDGHWTVVAEGEFANIQANPIPQNIRFSPVTAQEIRFTATRFAKDGENHLKANGLFLLQ